MRSRSTHSVPDGADPPIEGTSRLLHPNATEALLLMARVPGSAPTPSRVREIHVVPKPQRKLTLVPEDVFVTAS